MPDWAALRIDFPITKYRIYLNNGAYTPLPLPAIQAVTNFLVEYSETGPDTGSFYQEVKARAMAVRQEVADLIHARKEEIVFTESATASLNLVANSFPWQPGDTLLIRDHLHEHPANYLPWLHLARTRGLRLHSLPVDETGYFPLDALEAALDSRPRLLVISHVLYNTGAILPAQEIIRRAHERRVPVLVDASQSVGCLPVDVQELGCDFMAFTAAKWLCGPLGIGLLYCREDAAQQLEPVEFGPDATERYSENGYEYAPMPGRLQEGFRNWPGVFGLSAVLRYILRLGIAQIRERVMNLANLLIDRLQSLPGFTLHSPADPSQRNSITTFSLPGLPARQLVDALLTEKIVLAEREIWERKVVRASPHFYNDEDEIERTAAAIRHRAKRL